MMYFIPPYCITRVRSINTLIQVKKSDPNPAEGYSLTDQAASLEGPAS